IPCAAMFAANRCSSSTVFSTSSERLSSDCSSSRWAESSRCERAGARAIWLSRAASRAWIPATRPAARVAERWSRAASSDESIADVSAGACDASMRRAAAVAKSNAYCTAASDVRCKRSCAISLSVRSGDCDSVDSRRYHATVKCKCCNTCSAVTGDARPDAGLDASGAGVARLGAACVSAACACTAVANATLLTNAPTRQPNARIALWSLCARGTPHDASYASRNRCECTRQGCGAGASTALKIDSCIVAPCASERAVEPRVHGRRTRENTAACERKRAAADRRNRSASLTDDERRSGEVPRRKRELPERLESSARDVAQVECGRSGTSNACRRARNGLELSQIPRQLLERAEREAGAYERERWIVDARDRDRRAVARGAFAQQSRERFPGNDVAHDARRERSANHQRDRYRVLRIAVQEVGRAVERIDDEERLGIERRIGRELFAEDARRRRAGEQRFAHDAFRARVDIAHVILMGFGSPFERVAMHAALGDELRGRARRSMHHREKLTRARRDVCLHPFWSAHSFLKCPGSSAEYSHPESCTSGTTSARSRIGCNCSTATNVCSVSSITTPSPASTSPRICASARSTWRCRCSRRDSTPTNVRCSSSRWCPSTPSLRGS